MRTFKIVVGIVLALAFFALCNATISFFYEPYGSRSDISWSEYSKMEKMDTVIVGTSLTQHAINPIVMDEQTGDVSFNLATPSQSIEDSFIGIQTAYEDHGIKRAILGLSRTSITSSGPPNACSPFLHLRGKFVPFSQTFSAVNQMLWRYGASTTETSINWMFPWIGNHVKPSISNFAETAQAKITQADLIEACESYDPGWKYVDRGHGSRGSSLNYNSHDARPIAEGGEGEEGDDAGASSDVSSRVDPDRANTIRDICAYCRENGIELIVTSVPLPLFNVVDSQSGYFDLKHDIEQICTGEGVAYYDFNFATSDLFASEPDYFYDSSHFNLAGAREFSKSLGIFLKKLDAGEDVSKYFMGEDELMKSVDYITLVVANDTVDADGIHIHARAIAGSNVEAEYQFLVQDAESEKWTVVRDWSTDAAYTLVPESRGPINIRVNARQVGTDVKYEHFRVIEELY